MSATHFEKSVSFLGTYIVKPCEKKRVPQKVIGKNFLGWYVTPNKLQQTVHYNTCYNFV